MLLTITVQLPAESELDATDLSHLLRKHPDKVQAFELPVGQAHVFYPRYSAQETTVALLIDINAVDLVRSKRFRGDSGLLDYYVNDRPYASSSLSAVAIGKVFRSAMTGVSISQPQLAKTALPLVIDLPVVSIRGSKSDDLARRLFEPLGWVVEQRKIPLDEQLPQWGASQYSALRLRGELLLDQALRQLYVLLPVMDDSKHYWVNEDEAEKLSRQGEGWLFEHPERELITQRYLAHQKSLVHSANSLMEVKVFEPEAREQSAETGRAVPLRVERARAVVETLKEHGAQRVIDMGCGPGALLLRLQADPFFTKIVGTDVSARSLERAAQSLHLDERSDAEQERIQLLHSSAVYRDDRLTGFDATVLMEVIEHVDPSRLAALQDAVFASSRSRIVIVTTPNVEYNQLYPDLEHGHMRHDDHRFEWDRRQFTDWARATADQHEYTVAFREIGSVDERVGTPTQMAIFSREQA